MKFTSGDLYHKQFTRLEDNEDWVDAEEVNVFLTFVAHDLDERLAEEKYLTNQLNLYKTHYKYSQSILKIVWETLDKIHAIKDANDRSVVTMLDFNDILTNALYKLARIRMAPDLID